MVQKKYAETHGIHRMKLANDDFYPPKGNNTQNLKPSLQFQFQFNVTLMLRRVLKLQSIEARNEASHPIVHHG
jgi:hypothetical protein